MNPLTPLLAPDIERFERETGVTFRTAFWQNADGSLNDAIMPADLHMEPWPGFPAGIE